jgi:methionyl-tRNA synthetase
MSWLDGGLTPRAITRDLDWGIPVPLEEAKGKVLYVWFDAPIGYISATRQWCLDHQQDWKDWWQHPDTELIHFVGKDNIVFHCIIFPAMLKAHGAYNLPVNVPANQFLNFEGQKFSKSRNWGIEQHEYLEVFADFPNKEDALRWTILRIMPENKDADFKWDEFVEYHDKDLADNLGNFVNRVLTLTHKYYEGKVPAAAVHQEVLEKAKGYLQKIDESIEQFNFRNAAQAFVDLSSLGNLYLQESAPWLLYKANPEDPAIAQSLFTSLQIVGILSTYAATFIPFTAVRLRKMLGLAPLEQNAIAELQKHLRTGVAVIPEGHVIGQPEILFAKIDDKRDPGRMALVQAQKDKLQQIMEADKPAVPVAPAVTTPVAPEIIQYEDFAKLDLRTATIIEASAVPKADKLLMLKLDLGYEQRTVVSGIALHYQPENIIGQKVLLLANLAPRKMRGVESQGMILMAENEEGKLSFVAPPGDWPNGMKVS